MFATNSLVELTPVVELDGTPLDVSAADIVRELRDLYRERVNQECGIHLP
jgi:branched-subunit amino acid aminotransferase/4-amino-4-deoxychorismate lyase